MTTTPTSIHRLNVLADWVRRATVGLDLSPDYARVDEGCPISFEDLAAELDAIGRTLAEGGRRGMQP